MADPDAVAALKYRFVVAIEACIDAGHHIVASELLRAPRDYADVFLVLAESGYLPEDLAAPLGDMARFRNLLVHGYQRVDDRRVVEILHSRLEDFEALRRAIARSALD